YTRTRAAWGMPEGQLLMTQAERDRLVALKKAKKKLITQKEAAEELGITERHVRRLLRELKRRGDQVVAHGLRGLPSNRKISADTEREAVAILSRPVYRGFGPTLAAEYLAKKHDIEASRETVRGWMMEAKLCRERKQHVEEIHEWRPRRSRVGELRPSFVASGSSTSRRSMNGVRGVAVWGSWCSGTRATTTGWKDVGRRSC